MNEIKKILGLTFFMVLFVFSSELFAQETTDSLEVHTIKGRSYYIHIVEKGESLYSIHKNYGVPLDVIQKENPSVLDGLSIGEKIFIPVKKNPVEATNLDGNFIDHEVKKRQTLYSIARIYKVKQNKIILANPEISEGLKQGMILKIPLSDIKKDTPPKTKKSDYKTHKVVQGETLYSLSKTYDVTIDSIKIVNDGLKSGLKVDEVIFIPTLLDTQFVNIKGASELSILEIDNLIAIANDSVVKKSLYKIGLMLPFYLDENDEITEKNDAFKEKGVYTRSRFAIEFYNGFMMALDSLSSDSLQFEVYVYDTKGRDSSVTKKILLKDELKTLDMIVGPLYRKNFKQAARFAKQNRIPIISPVNQNNKVLLGNQYVFKVIPSKSTSINQIVKLTVDSFRTENLIAVEYNKSSKKSLVPLYVKSYENRLLEMNDTLFYSPIKTLKIDKNYSDIIASLKIDKNNVLFIPVVNKTYVTNLFNYLVTTLNKREYKDYKVTLIGQEEWLMYDNIDLEYYQKLNVHLSVPKYVDYETSYSKIIIDKYISHKNSYPSVNALLGYDLAYFFGNCFKETGTLFGNQNSSQIGGQGVSLMLNFFRTGLESGYENMSTYVIKFDNYMLKRVQ